MKKVNGTLTLILVLASLLFYSFNSYAGALQDPVGEGREIGGVDIFESIPAPPYAYELETLQDAVGEGREFGEVYIIENIPTPQLTNKFACYYKSSTAGLFTLNKEELYIQFEEIQGIKKNFVKEPHKRNVLFQYKKEGIWSDEKKSKELWTCALQETKQAYICRDNKGRPTVNIDVSQPTVEIDDMILRYNPNPEQIKRWSFFEAAEVNKVLGEEKVDCFLEINLTDKQRAQIRIGQYRGL